MDAADFVVSVKDVLGVSEVANWDSQKVTKAYLSLR